MGSFFFSNSSWACVLTSTVESIPCIAPLMKTKLSSHRSYHFKINSLLSVLLYTQFSFHTGILIQVKLVQVYAFCHSPYAFIDESTLFYLENAIFESSTTSCFYNLSTSYFLYIPEPWVGCDAHTPFYSECYKISHSLCCPVVALCVNCHLLQKKHFSDESKGMHWL